MAEFLPAFDAMLANEGGYLVHHILGDRGGQTYAGIARNHHPDWPGWSLIDAGQRDGYGLTTLVREFYRVNFWARIRGDHITSQRIANSVFDFAVNAGTSTAISLAQRVLSERRDGIIGPITLNALNSVDPIQFTARYALAKISRYAEICTRDASQSRFLLGWVNRSLRGA
jgi:lysozyme family protein